MTYQCQHVGCTMFASVVPVICFGPIGMDIHEAKRRNAIIRSICGIPICVLHKEQVTVQDLMDREQIEAIFLRLGKAKPNLDEAWLEFEEVEKGMTLLEDMPKKADL